MRSIAIVHHTYNIEEVESGLKVTNKLAIFTSFSKEVM